MNEKTTAYVLNELPPDERAAFEAQMKNDPALQKQADEMKAFCLMLEQEVAQNADDALMPAQRAQLVQSFQNSSKIIRPLWRRPAFLSTLGLAAAACLAVMLTVRHLREEPLEAARGYMTARTDAPVPVEQTDSKRNEPRQKQEGSSRLVQISPLSKKKGRLQPPAVNAPQPAVPSVPLGDAVLNRAVATIMPVAPAESVDKFAFNPEPQMAATDGLGRKKESQSRGDALRILNGLDQSGSNAESTGSLNLKGANLYADVTTKNADAAFQFKSDIGNVNAGGLAKAGIGGTVGASEPGSFARGGAGNQVASVGGKEKITRTEGKELLFDDPARQAGRGSTSAPSAAQKQLGVILGDRELAEKPASSALAGDTSETLALNKTGSGTVTLSGVNTYTGGTTVSAGTLNVKNGDEVVNGIAASSGIVHAEKDSDSIPTPLVTLSSTGQTAGNGKLVASASSYDLSVDAAAERMLITDNKSNAAEEPASAPLPKKIAATTEINGRLGDDTIDSERSFFRRMAVEERPVPRSHSASTATYRPIIENPFTYVAQQPLSTFSLDVDTASYANVRRFLNSGQRPPSNAVRLEELVNYFPYHYEGPAADRPIAVQVDLAEAPWQPLHRIARVAVKAREVKGERSAANFVFLLDVSGSMEPRERLPLIKQSLKLLVDQLREDDRVAIVTYAGESGIALKSTPGSQKEKIRQAIQKLSAGGSTNGASGIRLAYEQAALNFNKERINRVILCTDGDFNVGTSSVDELEKLIAEKAKGGVFLSVLGVGTDNLHDHTMQALADCGNGNYHYLDSIGEARKVLVEQMTGTLITVAKDVKLQVEFNPAQVAAYRLIGYEKRMLAKEDFNNDKKDAGEIGAGHTVTALYEIVPASLKYPDGKPLVDDLKYALAPTTKAALDESAAKPVAAPATHETMTVKVRYKEPDADQSKLFEVAVTDAHKKLSENDRDFQFAVSVAGFGMLLRGSPNANELTWDGVRRLALAGKGDDEQGWRGEFIQLIEKARGLCEEQR